MFINIIFFTLFSLSNSITDYSIVITDLSFVETQKPAYYTIDTKTTCAKNTTLEHTVWLLISFYNNITTKNQTHSFNNKLIYRKARDGI